MPSPKEKYFRYPDIVLYICRLVSNIVMRDARAIKRRYSCYAIKYYNRLFITRRRYLINTIVFAAFERCPCSCLIDLFRWCFYITYQKTMFYILRSSQDEFNIRKYLWTIKRFDVYACVYYYDRAIENSLYCWTCGWYRNIFLWFGKWYYATMRLK